MLSESHFKLEEAPDFDGVERLFEGICTRILYSSVEVKRDALSVDILTNGEISCSCSLVPRKKKQLLLKYANDQWSLYVTGIVATVFSYAFKTSASFPTGLRSYGTNFQIDTFFSYLERINGTFLSRLIYWKFAPSKYKKAIRFKRIQDKIIAKVTTEGLFAIYKLEES